MFLLLCALEAVDIFIENHRWWFDLFAPTLRRALGLWWRCSASSII